MDRLCLPFSDGQGFAFEVGDAVLFSRGVVHTFTAPLGDLTLLSYHAPFFEFDDTRQSTIAERAPNCDWDWAVSRLECQHPGVRFAAKASVV